MRTKSRDKPFSTLFPIHGFREWLKKYLSEDDKTILTSKDSEIIKSVTGSKSFKEGFHKILNSEWYADPIVSESLKAPLTKLCAHYPLKEKRDERAYDLVENFHLTNGACIERINWLADSSKKGTEQSLGMMVNYYYKLSQIAKNHEYYVTETKIATSKDVKSLLRN